MIYYKKEEQKNTYYRYNQNRNPTFPREKKNCAHNTNMQQPKKWCKHTNNSKKRKIY